MSGDHEDKTVIANLSSLMADTTRKKGSPSLVQYSGAILGKRYPLSSLETKIGRSPEADITIPEASVSRIHAKLSLEEEAVFIEDVGSANGTYINDQKVSVKTPLKDQDMIRLGTVILKFFSSDNIDGFVQDKIYRMATIDAGTQTYNKQYMIDALGSEFKATQLTGNPLSVIYYDLDFFKKVNDTYGHSAGDLVLKETTSVAKKVIRKDDIHCRYGGEEFVIILPRTNLAEAKDLAERVRLAIEAHPFMLAIDTPSGQELKQHTQTISAGVSQFIESMNTPEDLLSSADKKLYTSKHSGRNRVTV